MMYSRTVYVLEAFRALAFRARTVYISDSSLMGAFMVYDTRFSTKRDKERERDEAKVS